MSDIRRCPFCGGKASVNARQSGFHGENFDGNKKISWTLYVMCNRCKARGKPIKTKPILYDGYCGTFWNYKRGSKRSADEEFKPYEEKAIEAWNKRFGEE